MTESYQMYPSIVTAVEQLTPSVKRFTFKRVDGEHYPEFSAGSHIFLKMNDKLSNAYSLVSSAKDLSQYQVCVQEERDGKGGSLFMHKYGVGGFELEISSPNNMFELSPLGEKHVLIAGGIGITPFMTHMEALALRGVDYELHYAFREPERATLLDELHKDHANRVQTYMRSEGRPLDVEQLIASQPLGTHVYVCGPKSMITATIDACNKHRFRDEWIHWEQFSADTAENGQAFTVVLAKSNHRVEVKADQTILQAIESLNIDVECMCREGACGTCETTILAGEAEHLDHYLDDDEKMEQKTMMICVSRAKSPELVLDL